MSGPRILVFDSGLGGLTVLRELRVARPDAAFTYLADTACFPYGALSEERLVERVGAVIGAAIAKCRPDLVVIACHTASTLVLPHLRAAHCVPVVGTVPAIKPAAAATRSRMVSVLATPGTVKRDYTRALIDTYAFHVDVTLVGATALAGLAEQVLRGEPVEDAAIAAEIAPAFRKKGKRRTDVVVLACTHYPLIRQRLERLARWPVTWIDPAPAIARHAASLISHLPVGPAAGPGEAVFTTNSDSDALAEAFETFGLRRVRVEPVEIGLERHAPVGSES